MILTPPEIYDDIFDTLSVEMYRYRNSGQWVLAEQKMSDIEFLEKHLVKDISPQSAPVTVVEPPPGYDIRL